MVFLTPTRASSGVPTSPPRYPIGVSHGIMRSAGGCDDIGRVVTGTGWWLTGGRPYMAGEGRYDHLILPLTEGEVTSAGFLRFRPVPYIGMD